MKIYKTSSSIILEEEGNCYIAHTINWDEFINRDDLFSLLTEEIKTLPVAGELGWLTSQKLLAPIGSQEVWAAGVTYLRSKVARMEESAVSGGATFYDKVYDAERPELFFKSVAAKVVGNRGFVRTRKDSTWDVPEPELTLVITSSGKIVGYTIGNDMSSRSIEGENPLYLPQAKTYDRSAAIGPCILVSETIKANSFIKMIIQRSGKSVFEGSTTIDQMKRTHTELASFLFRENSFNVGCYLMTGTCVVPENDFTLESGDVITISIEQIGDLVNIVE